MMFGGSCPHLAPCGLCVKYDKPCADVLGKKRDASHANGGNPKSHTQEDQASGGGTPQTGSVQRAGE